MKDDKYFFDFTEEPGKKLKENYIKYTNKKPLVSIITSYYNGNEYMNQTVNCVFNQTFPYWEWIIVDDGSDDEKSLQYLEELEKKDERIHVFHKENGGLATGRDYAIKFSNTEYILPLDSDDLIEPTYIETLFWSLETNKECSWAFTNSTGFGKWIYLTDCKFNSETMKTDNQITATALIRKEKILELGGYSIAKRYVNEDWHLWLRMLQKGYFPVQLNYYGMWYRRREQSLLTEINDEQNEENKLRLRDIKIEADKITNKVEAKIYPLEDEDDDLDGEYSFIYEENKINQKKAYCYCINTVPRNKEFYKEVKEKSNNYEVYIVTTRKIDYSSYVYRQKLEKYCTIFDLPTFLDRKYYASFVEYLMKTRSIEELHKTKYTDNEKVYKREIRKYKLKHTLIGRAIRKAIRIIKNK